MTVTRPDADEPSVLYGKSGSGNPRQYQYVYKFAQRKAEHSLSLRIWISRKAFNNIGGTQIHVKELTMALRDEYNVFVAARDEEYLRLTIYTDKDVVSLKFEIGEAPKFPVFRDEKDAKDL